MKNNKLIKYKENIFTKISNFFRKIFLKEKDYVNENRKKELAFNHYKEAFIDNIRVEENQEEKRLKKLQLQYDNGDIKEDDILEEDIDKLIVMYEKEIKELNAASLENQLRHGQIAQGGKNEH